MESEPCKVLIVTKSSRKSDEPICKETASQDVGAARVSEAENLESQGFLRGAMSVFILFHLIAIICWTVPTNFAPIRDVKEIVRPYMLWSGLFQSWDTFAPNPKSVNSYIEAVVITRSRHQIVWVFPRMDRLGFGERYGKERYRKFAEVLPDRKNAYLWPDVAKHVARLFDSQTDPVEMVLLIEFQAPIRAGDSKTSNPIPKPTLFYEYVNYAQSEDLK